MANPLLTDIYREFEVETQDVLSCFQTQLPIEQHIKSSCSVIHLYGQEMCVIRLLDAWSRFCRELIILCAGCQPVTSSGQVVSLAPGITSRNDAVASLSNSPRGKEPAWHVASECIGVLRRLNIHNRAQIIAALGAANSPADDLRNVRNYFAHRNDDTISKVEETKRRLTLSSHYKAMDIVMERVSPGITLFEMWVTLLKIIAQDAIK